MTINEARKIARYWQEQLRLRDWDVTLRWGSASEMKDGAGDDALGLNTWFTDESKSTIILSKKLDDAATEQTIVHELLHLVIDAPRGAFKGYDVVTERAINTIADALLLRHGGVNHVR